RRILSVAGVAVVAANGVIMDGNLADEQRYTLGPAHLAQIAQAQSLPLTRLHGRISLHVGESKSRLAISSVGRPQQREQCGVLGNRHQLPITKSPALGRKVKREDSDFSYEWIR